MSYEVKLLTTLGILILFGIYFLFAGFKSRHDEYQTWKFDMFIGTLLILIGIFGLISFLISPF